MSIVMDNRIESTNKGKEEEVRKLQELVKKLEIQNEELRSERQSLLSKNKETNNSMDKNETEKAEKETNKTVPSPEKETEKSQENHPVPLEIDLRLSLTSEGNLLSDDETWLFDSPKAVPQNDWLRKDLNDPSLVVVKKSLVKKLDEITNSPKHSPRHSIYSPSSSSSLVSPESPTTTSRGEIDTRTFIRPKKRRSLTYESFTNDDNRHATGKKDHVSSFGFGCQNGSREYLGRSSGSLGSEEEDRLSSASDGSYSSFRLADVEDVNALARLQEESLRFPEPSPVARMSGARNMTKILPRTNEFGTYNRSNVPTTTTGSSGNSATSSQEDLLTSQSCGPSHQCSPRRVPTRSALAPPRKYPSSGIPPPTSRENSDMSTPPDSPYTSHQNLAACNGRNMGSRLPSLTRQLGGSNPRLLDIHTSPNNSRTSSPLPSYSAKQGPGPDLKAPPARTSRLQTPQARSSRLSAPSPVRIPMGPTHVVETARQRTPEVVRHRASPGGTSGSNNIVTASPSNSSALPRPGSRLQTPSKSYPSLPQNLVLSPTGGKAAIDLASLDKKF